jgi:integrase/recombinase XerD
MTNILARDPARRCKPESEWPEGDRDRRAQALIGGDVIEGGGSLADYSVTSIKRLDSSYGRWLQWLDTHGELDPAASPAARVTRQRAAAYTDDLLTVNGTRTVTERLEALFYMCRALDHDCALPWLLRMAAVVRARNVPVRVKAPRIVGADELFRLGLRLMEQAAKVGTARQQAVQYRNGLIISLLAACPMRRRNLAMLRIGDNLIRNKDEWWIDIPGPATKTGVPIVLPLPAELTSYMDEYIAHCRPVLLRMRGHRYRAPGDEFWISEDGSPMSYNSLYKPIIQATRTAFGKAINPHLFRDCGATSVAVADPDHVRIIGLLLGHTPLSSTAERHYNQARSHEAGRRWQANVLALREGTATDPEDESEDRRAPPNREADLP